MSAACISGSTPAWWNQSECLDDPEVGRITELDIRDVGPALLPFLGDSGSPTFASISDIGGDLELKVAMPEAKVWIDAKEHLAQGHNAVNMEDTGVKW